MFLTFDEVCVYFASSKVVEESPWLQRVSFTVLTTLRPLSKSTELDSH